MNYTEFIYLIKNKWYMIAISIVVGIIVVLIILYVIGLLVLPAEITSSSGAITYNNS